MQFLASIWHYLVIGLTIVLAVLGSGHALLYKRDSRAALLWVSFIWLAPLVGATLYFILGVNRIRRRAMMLRGDLERYYSPSGNPARSPDSIRKSLPVEASHLSSTAKAIDEVVARPLVIGNQVEPLTNGDEAYPAMLEAIAQAQRSIALSTYIFDRDEVGLAFTSALGEAARRGVEVRVLIDATGTRYSWPSILGSLRREGIRHARFLRTFPLTRIPTANLRSHRKILVVDGQVGFTGGINIRAGHWLAKKPARPVQDMHFRITGPLVAHLQEVFADDWLFTTDEHLRGDEWFPKLESTGTVIGRGIADGPDEDYDKLRWSMLAALAVAQRSVRVVTPYFLPDAALISSLNLAALRGAAVDIILPSKSNLAFVQWASTAQWWQMLERGCRIWLSPPPFDHSKFFVVDDYWTLIGSANWDPRSLRLNFEFNVECYDATLARTLSEVFEAKRSRSRRITLAEVDARPLPIRLRDGVARLFTPFL